MFGLARKPGSTGEGEVRIPHEVKFPIAIKIKQENVDRHQS